MVSIRHLGRISALPAAAGWLTLAQPMRSSSVWPALACLALAYIGCNTAPAIGATSSTSGTGGASSTSSTHPTTSSFPACGGDGGPPCGPDTYEAVTVSTSPPRFAVLKASPSRSLCFQIMVLDGAGMGLSGFSGDMTVESGLVSGDAADCEVASAPLPVPAGPTYPVVSGHGTVSMDGPPACSASVHVTLVFSGAPAWVPPSEPMDADGLVLAFGCP